MLNWETVYHKREEISQFLWVAGSIYTLSGILMVLRKGHRDYQADFFSQVVTVQNNINACHIPREFVLLSF